jgi:hypothetical protein
MSTYLKIRRVTHLRYDVARVREIFSVMLLEFWIVLGMSHMVLEWRQTYRNIYGKYRNGSIKFRKFQMYGNFQKGGTHRPRTGWAPCAPCAGQPAGWVGERNTSSLHSDWRWRRSLLFPFQFRWDFHIGSNLSLERFDGKTN